MNHLNPLWLLLPVAIMVAAILLGLDTGGVLDSHF